MRRIDELHLKRPFYGSRKLADALRKEGREANRKRVQRLMRRMGLEAMAPEAQDERAAPRTRRLPVLAARPLDLPRKSGLGDGHHVHPDEDEGFVYLVAIMDWYSRRVLSWRLSNTLDSSFCVGRLSKRLLRGSASRRSSTPTKGRSSTAERLHEAASRARHCDQHGRQGPLPRQRLRRAALALTQGAYEEVYLHEYDSVPEARAGIGRYLAFYNDERPHQALGYRNARRLLPGWRRQGRLMRSVLHNTVPNLSVSPLALPPLLRFASTAGPTSTAARSS